MIRYLALQVAIMLVIGGLMAVAVGVVLLLAALLRRLHDRAGR